MHQNTTASASDGKLGLAGNLKLIEKLPPSG